MAAELQLANPRGFCAGVDRAIAIVNRALELFGTPVYVRHEVVHNRFVVQQLQQRGAVFVDTLAQVPRQSTVIFSAHGVSQRVVDEARQRQLQVFDATCPLVTKVHLEVARHDRDGDNVVMIGHAGHPEVEGTLGRYHGSAGGEIVLVESVADVAKLAFKQPRPLYYVTQTTLSMEDTRDIVEALKRHFADIRGQNREDICYATQNRQEAVKALAQQCDLLLVVGSANSSNSNRLREVAARSGCESYLIDSAADIQLHWLQGRERIGLTAGASAPEVLVEEVIAYLQQQGVDYQPLPQRSNEEIIFPLPKMLR
ncbi:4-hydroxy-3-methylbut-2-enyl diphosphate reductase [Ectothiorhodospiraceae bacterium BW-2]|nr:4-hydroxy-3-methylbut-2-enyl diphosphate reductase [Ectothiorhodospiraceae bacterium BW-2]